VNGTAVVEQQAAAAALAPQLAEEIRRRSPGDFADLVRLAAAYGPVEVRAAIARADEYAAGKRRKGKAVRWGGTFRTALENNWAGCRAANAAATADGALKRAAVPPAIAPSVARVAEALNGRSSIDPHDPEDPDCETPDAQARKVRLGVEARLTYLSRGAKMRAEHARNRAALDVLGDQELDALADRVLAGAADLERGLLARARELAPGRGILENGRWVAALTKSRASTA
jgi:hypothetical protein